MLACLRLLAQSLKLEETEDSKMADVGKLEHLFSQEWLEFLPASMFLQRLFPLVAPCLGGFWQEPLAAGVSFCSGLAQRESTATKRRAAEACTSRLRGSPKALSLCADSAALGCCRCATPLNCLCAHR
jgi:hypothetical protein